MLVLKCGLQSSVIALCSMTGFQRATSEAISLRNSSGEFPTGSMYCARSLSRISGSDSTWVDNVDIAFFAGHGNPQGPIFGTTIDSGQATPNEVRLGDLDLEWIAFHACQVLQREGVFDRWGPSFTGLHYMLGFDTICHDETNRGRYFADHLNNGWRVRDAWIAAAQETEGSDCRWAYLRADAAGTNTYEDHWHGKGFVSSDPDVPTVHYYLRGAC